MSREVVVKVWCDACPEDDPHDGKQYVITFGTRAEPRALDLCEGHAAELIEPLDALVKAFGQRLNGSAPEPPKEPRRERPTPPSASRVPCPACEDTQIRSALPGHIFRVHLRRKVPLYKRCPDCNWKPPPGAPPATVPRAVGAHRAREHGTNLMSDALAALEASKTNS